MNNQETPVQDEERVLSEERGAHVGRPDGAGNPPEPAAAYAGERYVRPTMPPPFIPPGPPHTWQRYYPGTGPEWAGQPGPLYPRNGVASTVRLMSMHIIGFVGEQAIPYAIKLGIALQITNILRDVEEDWRSGRVYLPMDEMAAFGLTEADLDRGQVDEHWRVFLRFQIERNRHLYAQARPGIAMLSRDGRFAVAEALDLYRAILDDIEAHDYDVFRRRAHVSAWSKVRRLPSIWWRNRSRTEKPL